MLIRKTWFKWVIFIEERERRMMENRAALATRSFITSAKLSSQAKIELLLTPSPPQTFSRRQSQGSSSRCGGWAYRKGRGEGRWVVYLTIDVGDLPGRPWEL